MKVYSSSRASLRAAALVAGFLALVAPARGQVINEDFKLLASDGAALDQFGWSIAIDNGVQSGSAYLFDVPTSVPGDVNCDGSVTPGDAQAAFDFFLGISTPACIADGDLCPIRGDGSVTPGDAQGIFNMFLGLPIPCG